MGQCGRMLNDGTDFEYICNFAANTVDVSILPFEEKDIEEAKELQPAGWPDILSHMQYYARSEYCRPYKLLHNEKISGIGAVICHGRTAWLAHIIVHPDHRNKGFGKMMTQHLIESVDRSIYETILLIATELGEPIYRKLGFKEETEYLFYTRETLFPQTSDIPGISPYKSKYLDEMLALDLLISGEDRSWRLKQHLEGAIVYIENNKIEGYHLPSLGEGLIVASGTTAGINLMKFRNSRISNSALPVNNSAGVAFMRDNGFKEIRRAKRMHLGKKINWQPKNLYNRVSGQIG
jgi:GNAT superfamily N-acetyltransferase